ncbi:MAG TPA: PIG-L deacetylase family protein [Sphaerochaeta sp.]|nr:PIG-L deacetylase family protein [Sphaerochaeta sp.]
MVDFLVITAHPDDEAAVAGLLLKAKASGCTTGLICLTQGESGGFAARQQRIAELHKAVHLLHLDYFKLLDFPDAGIEFTTEGVERLIPLLRESEARTVLTIHPEDYHPDHRAVSQLVDRSLFVAGLNKYSDEGETWHPSQVLYFSLDPKSNPRRADVIVDVSEVMDEKRRVLQSYASQEIELMLVSWSEQMGFLGGFRYAEGYYLKQPLRLENVQALLNSSKSGR